MTNSRECSRPHSAEYFGVERDFWWNSDFLDLMADRLKFGGIRSIADIGCGVGHWSALIHTRLPEGAELIGIDNDPANVAQAGGRFTTSSGGRMQFRQGDAMALPLLDNSVDAATCQTLLIHLPDPAGAVDEMVRITRPGGLVFVAEPNNLMNYFGASSLTVDTPVDVQLRNVEFAIRHTVGRSKRGLGCMYIGDLLPGILAKAGLRDVQVWLSDKVIPLMPPYDRPDQRAELAALRRWNDEGSGPFDEADIRANILAGGGREELIETSLRDLELQTAAVLDGVRDGSYHAARGGLHYIVAGRVPGRK